METALSNALQVLSVVWSFIIGNWYFSVLLIGIPLLFAGLAILSRIVHFNSD